MISAELPALARETRDSVAQTDALIARLRRTEALIIGRSISELARDRSIATRESCERAEALERLLARCFKQILASL